MACTTDACLGASGCQQHKVTLTPYYMELTETTVAQYQACVDSGACTEPNLKQPSKFGTFPGLANHPVNFVNWEQSRAYCKWPGASFDLPTEAQSEMAARGSCEKNGSGAGDAGCTGSASRRSGAAPTRPAARSLAQAGWSTGGYPVCVSMPPAEGCAAHVPVGATTGWPLRALCGLVLALCRSASDFSSRSARASTVAHPDETP